MLYHQFSLVPLLSITFLLLIQQLQSLNCTIGTSNCISGTCASGYRPISMPTYIGCQPCSPSNCKTCNASPLSCQKCNPNYRAKFNSTSGKYYCRKCVDPNCFNCDNIASECRLCSLGYRTTASLGCEKCVDLNCNRCVNNVNQCTGCAAGFGVFSNGGLVDCQPCRVVDCRLCPQNSMTCASCIAGYTLIGNLCQVCNITNCQQCKANNFSLCQMCTIPYGVNNTFLCETCSDNNCLNCSLDYQTCTECRQHYGVNNNTGVSELCDAYLSSCQSCEPTNYRICINCKIGYYMVNGDCLACNSTCIACSSLHVCQQCQIGYYVYENVTVCQPCSSHCNLDMYIMLNLLYFAKFNQNPKAVNTVFALNLVNVLLLFAVMVVSYVFLIYHIVYICYLKPKEELTDEEKVMKQLQQLNFRSHNQNSRNKNGVFRQIMLSKMNVLDFSNYLQHQDKKASQQKQINFTNSRQFQEPNNLQQNRKISQIQQKVAQVNQLKNKIQQQQQRDVQQEEYRRNKQKIYAMQVMKKDNQYIRLKNAIDYTDQLKNQGQDKNCVTYIYQYEAI